MYKGEDELMRTAAEEQKLLKEISNLEGAIWSDILKYRSRQHGRLPSHILVSYDVHQTIKMGDKVQLTKDGESLFNIQLAPTDAVTSFKVVGGIED